MNNKALAWVGILIASWMLVFFIAKAVMWTWHFASQALVIGIFAIAAWLIWQAIDYSKSARKKN